MEVRDYNSKSYLDAINHYPLFWNSVRGNTLKAGSYGTEITLNLEKLKKLYPELKPATIYFTMGALLSGGTTLGDKVLIGSEIAMADEHTITSELPEKFGHLKTHFKTNPINILVFTNVHEYVHTQQKTTASDNLLAQCTLEGVAELVAEKASGKSSTLPAIAYGKSNSKKVKKAFAGQMFNQSNGFWLYSNAENEFGERDLGYYVGHAICENVYNRAKDKKQAIKEMIELDYNNEKALSAFVNQSGYFDQTIEMLKVDYEKHRPVVLSIAPFKNDEQGVNPKTTQITISFSAAMDKRYRNFALGPLGKENLLRLKRFIGFSEDGKQAILEVELMAGQHYQLVLGPGFRNESGAALKPYLLNFQTAER